MAARSKTFGANLPVPQSREEAAVAVGAIGELNRSLARLETDMNEELAASKAAYEAAAEPFRQSRTAEVEGLKIWAEANRSVLTGGDRTKTVDLGTGKLMWRRRPPAVRITGLEEVIGRLKALGLGRFLRTKEEIDREAMQREPEAARAVPGVAIGSAGEDFVVEPYEAALSLEPQGGA